MRFHNPTEHRLTFRIGGERVVEPGAECEIPDRLAYAVKGYGLPLCEGPAPKSAPKAAQAPASAPEPVKAPVVPPAAPSPPAASQSAAFAGSDGGRRRG